MAIYDFRIGAAPDFLMTKGKVIYPHKADVEFAFNSGAKSSVLVSNSSLSALIIVIKEKLVAIGWSKDDAPAWTNTENFTARVHARKGLGTVAFKFPEEMSSKQRPKMEENIKRLF